MCNNALKWIYLYTCNLVYGWSAGNLNWPIRIQQAGKILVSWCKVDKVRKGIEFRHLFSVEMALNIHEKGFSISKTILVGKGESMNHFVFLNFYFGAKTARHGNSLVVRRVSQGRIIIVLFWTKYVVSRQIKPGILKLTTSRGQRNLCTVLIFVSCEEKRLLSYRFARTPKFWLPIVLRAQPLYARNACKIHRWTRRALDSLNLGCSDSFL